MEEVTYWKSFIKCITCRHLQGKRYTYPPTLPLTSLRFNGKKPFSTIGVGNFGTCNVKDIYSSCLELFQGWNFIYTCGTICSIMLDIALDPSSEIFIWSFSSSVWRREYPEHVISDNGSNLIADKIRKFSIDYVIHWDVNLPLSPWHDGFRFSGLYDL